eukprot:2524508-Alexandrium_andersonii.AAC.1
MLRRPGMVLPVDAKSVETMTAFSSALRSTASLFLLPDHSVNNMAPGRRARAAFAPVFMPFLPATNRRARP